MRIGIFLPNWVGDACMATPSIRAVRSHFGPDAEVVAIGRQGPCEVLAGLPWVDEFIAYRPKGRPNALSRRDVAWRLRKKQLDIAILLTNSIGTTMMAWLGGARRRIGYFGNARRWLLSDGLTVPRENGKKKPVPAIDHYLKLVARLGCDISDRKTELAVDPSDQACAERIWREFGWIDQKKTIVVNSSGAFGSSKIWPSEKVVALSKILSERKGYQVLIHTGPGEREDANRTAKLCANPNVRSLGESQTPECRTLPLGISKAVIHRSELVVSTDSGPRHMAVALNRPVISLFGSTMPAWTLSYNIPEEMIFLGLPCQPCYQRECPLSHHACMRDIQVDRVLHSIQSRLSQDRPHFARPAAAPLPDVA